MKQYFKTDEWSVIEENFDPAHNKVSESVFSIGNGRMGQRANFEEQYSGKTLQGNYVAGIYYPDKTRVGWWKNGYPEYFAKVLNATNWIGIGIEIDYEILDLAQCEVLEFRRELNMKEGYLERSFTARLKSGKEVKVSSKRFCSIVNSETAVIRYSITPLNFDAKLKITPFLDADVKNEDSNYDEKFWDEVFKEAKYGQAFVTVRTKKTGFHLCTGMMFDIFQDGHKIEYQSQPIEKEKFVANKVSKTAAKGVETVIYKYVACITSENHEKETLPIICKQLLENAHAHGYENMLAEQAEAWGDKWKESDIIIDGDTAAQQGIRFNIFQLNQTYTGEDERLNIGPKGFTGEKYGGSTYWDTEAYCLPFYLATAPQKVARNLLIYRHKHLQKAIENAAKLGFNKGAALYPMVTMNGEECHNEWEITFEEIHRNGAIAFAIYDYVRYTGDESYLAEFGLDVLIGISRFWSQRITFSEQKQQYVMLGVTGPNEYENNINNNWYTNTIALWTMKYCLEAMEKLSKTSKSRLNEILKNLSFEKETETARWNSIIANMYLPSDEKLGIFLQQDGYLDKEQILVKDLPKEDRPLNQKWSWDRILRSCFIKQADVLQGIFLFEENFDIETIRRNYDFYEPRTVHESSLSPCVHAIIAAKLGDRDRAYEFYLRTSRLDIDDYNNDTEDGCHTTSMAGTWMSVVMGFGGMRVRNNELYFAPFLPNDWKSLSFKIRFRGNLLQIIINPNSILIKNISGNAISLSVFETKHSIESGKTKEIEHLNK